MKKELILLAVIFVMYVIASVPVNAIEMGLDYNVRIEDQTTGIVHLTERITNITQNNLTLSLQYPGGDPNAYVLSYACTGPGGALIPFELRSEQGEIPRIYWDVNVLGYSLINFTYSVLKQVWEGSGYHDYLGPEWGVFDNTGLFAEPKYGDQIIASEIENIGVSYEIPEGWTIVTPWPFDGQSYRPFSWWELYANVTAAGPLDVSTISIGGNLEARIGIYQDLLKDIDKNNFLAEMQALLEYFYEEFGPDNPLIAFSLIRPIPIFDQDSGESAFLLHSLDKTFLTKASYGLWESWQSHDRQRWAGIAFSIFYGYFAQYQIGWLSEAEFFRYLGHAYSKYQSDRNAGLDEPLSQAPEQESKGLLVVYMLDKVVQNVTSGETDINDVLHYLIENMTSNNSWDWNSQHLKKALLVVTGKDFSSFFANYIDGKTEITLPELADADDDGVVDHIEMIFQTNPAVQDTDADDLVDGVEVYVNLSDPTI